MLPPNSHHHPSKCHNNQSKTFLISTFTHVSPHQILTELSRQYLSCAPQRKPAVPVAESSCYSPPEERPALTRLLLVCRQWFPSWFEPSASRGRQSASPPPHPKPGVSLSGVVQEYPAALCSPSSFVSLLPHNRRHSAHG